MSRTIIIPLVLVIIVVVIFIAMFGQPKVAGPAPGTTTSDPATPAGS